MKVKTYLEATLQFPDQIWSWAVHQYPTDYSIIDPEERCNTQNLGDQIHSFDDTLGYLTLPGNESSIWNELKLNLTGSNGLWGRSLVLTNGTNYKICSSILPKSKDNSNVIFTAEAKFRKGVAGSMYFRWLKSEASNDLLIFSTL